MGHGQPASRAGSSSRGVMVEHGGVVGVGKRRAADEVDGGGGEVLWKEHGET